MTSKTYPTLRTKRLVLDVFTPADAPTVQLLAGDKDVAVTTLLIPHPYPDGAAEAWIATHQRDFDNGKSIVFAIRLRANHALIGCISLSLEPEHLRAEMGYWIGKLYWNQGYCTEAARAVIQFAFYDLGLKRICAHYFASNPASRRIMQKVGMQREGCLRQHVQKWQQWQDVEIYGILRGEEI